MINRWEKNIKYSSIKTTENPRTNAERNGRNKIRNIKNKNENQEAKTLYVKFLTLTPTDGYSKGMNRPQVIERRIYLCSADIYEGGISMRGRKITGVWVLELAVSLILRSFLLPFVERCLDLLNFFSEALNALLM